MVNIYTFRVVDSKIGCVHHICEFRWSVDVYCNFYYFWQYEMAKHCKSEVF